MRVIFVFFSSWRYASWFQSCVWESIGHRTRWFVNVFQCIFCQLQIEVYWFETIVNCRWFEDMGFAERIVSNPIHYCTFIQVIRRNSVSSSVQFFYVFWKKKSVFFRFQRIHGINWSHKQETHLTTASQDGTVKYFCIKNPRRAEKIITTSSPVWRARYTVIK